MTCKYCSQPILDNYYFCPSCGKKLKEPPFQFSTSRSLYILILSTLAPPFGIFPSLKYIVAPDIKAKIVGLVGIILNIVILTLATFYLVNTINKTVDQVNQLTNPQGSVQNQIETLQNSQNK